MFIVTRADTNTPKLHNRIEPSKLFRDIYLRLSIKIARMLSHNILNWSGLTAQIVAQSDIESFTCF